MNYFVIGNPIEHSLSPKIHNEILGLKESFGKIKVENLSEFMAGLKDYKGFNVTLPFKIEIIKYLGSLDTHAEAIGAVNTVYQNKGYNTDWLGFIRQCQSDNINLENANVKLLGSGGAARAIVYALQQSNVKALTVYNRTLEKAKKLVTDFFGTAENLKHFNNSNCDLIINTISIGVQPISYIGDVPAIDISYGDTQFLKLAQGKKYDGYKMLIYQAEESEKIWKIL